MFNKVLIANRGEIAIRVIRACRELGVHTVLAYSEADRDSLATRMADETICIGPAISQKSYLNTPAVISAALITGVDAIHPGTGFLAENPYVAEICERVQIKFIGPSAATLERMGDKAQARQLMAEAGLPPIPGINETLLNPAQAREAAEAIGYPVMLKAAAGGGGRGIRVIRNDAEMIEQYPIARAEAEASFGNGGLYLEKYLANARHIELQVLLDEHGHGIAAGERECSIQRRRQKMIEEGPSTSISPEVRARMSEAAVNAVLAIGYSNAGTIECLLDENNNFYFMEMNKRIQVEHPVTEMITGLDLVKWQLRIASGEPLAFTQKDIVLNGHAIECRVTAEDPQRNFQPDCAMINTYLPPGGPGMRVDSHIYAGYTIPPYYDSLLGKIIAWGHDRQEAIDRMERALDECVIGGVKTTLPVLRRILAHPAYRTNQVSTGFVEEHLEELTADEPVGV